MSRPQLPESLEMLSKSEVFSTTRHRWNTNEEIASILIGFDKHEQWLSKEVEIRPKSGSLLLYSRKRVRYRRDGYCWKKRKDGKTTREDHMKLKVQGTECIYGCYVHSAILPTFHRRCYWLLQNPDIVLVHYLNVPFTDDNKMITPTLSFADSKKEWTRDELISELRPMFFIEGDTEISDDFKLSSSGTIESLIQHLMARQRAKMRSTEDYNDGSTGARVAASRESSSSRTSSKDVTLKKPHETVVSTSPFLRSKPSASTVSNVHLLKLNSVPPVTTTSSVVANSVSSTPLIFNFSQLRNGNSILILNSPLSAANNNNNLRNNSSGKVASTTVSTPITFLCNKTSTNTLSSSPAVQINPTQQPNSNLINSTVSAVNKTRLFKENSTELMNIELLNGNVVPSARENGSNFALPANSRFQDTENLNHSGYHLPTTGNDAVNEAVCPSRTQNPSSVLSFPAQKHSFAAPTAFVATLDPREEQPFVAPVAQNLISNNETMDFIENDFSATDEDLFNLESFDMLTESFPSLGDLNSLTPAGFQVDPEALKRIDNENNNGSNRNICDNVDRGFESSQEFGDSNPRIADYSPEWSYSDGGMKVLVAGPWYSSSAQYNIVFDGISVQTALIQKGVLRCYSPPHEPGFVSLQVAIDGIPVSNSVIFEYRESVDTPTTQASENYFSVDDNVFKFCLMERLELLEAHVSTGTPDDGKNQKMAGKLFEQRLIASYKHAMSSPWLPCDVKAVTSQSLRRGSSRTDMSLIHLAAALGYSHLIRKLIEWRKENPSIILEVEVDAFSRDKNECTPLMWSLARGHRDTSIQLLRWNRGAINLCNKQGLSPLHVARKNWHYRLAHDIEELHKELLASSHSPEPRNETCISLFQQSTESPVDDSDKCIDQESGCLSQLQRNFCSSKQNSNECDLYAPRKACCCYLATAARFSLTNSSDTGFESGFTSVSDDRDDDDDDSTSKNCSANCLSSHRSSIEANESTSELLLDTNEQVLSFAENIIAAIPDRIKVESRDARDFSDSPLVHKSEGIVLQLPSQGHPGSKVESEEEESFLESAETTAYRSKATPTSSPVSSSCLHSPGSMNMESPTPPPTAEDLCEFFGAGRLMQKEFSSLTLSDQEQRELYEAAKTIQKAYRVYKGRKDQEQEKEKERLAAVLIQSYYRKYKQYIYYKQMTKAAQVIQNQFRSYCSKRFKKCSSCIEASCGSQTLAPQSYSSSSIVSSSCLFGSQNPEATHKDCQKDCLTASGGRIHSGDSIKQPDRSSSSCSGPRIMFGEGETWLQEERALASGARDSRK